MATVTGKGDFESGSTESPETVIFEKKLDNVVQKMNLYRTNCLMKKCSFILSKGIFLFCFFFSCTVFSQTKTIDSLTKELTHPKNDTFRIDVLYNLAQEQYGYDSTKGMQYLNEGNVLAKKMNFLFQMANYYQIKAKLKNDEPQTILWIDTAIQLYRKSISLNQTPVYNKKALLSIATCKADIANQLNKGGKYKEAIAAHLESLEAWKASDDPDRNEAIATIYNSIATVYYNIKNNQKALEYDKTALQYRLLDDNDELLAKSYFFVSDDYVLLSNLDSALAYVQKAEAAVKRINKPDLNYNYYNRMATIYKSKGQFKQAILYDEKALNEAKATGNPFVISNANRSLGLDFIETHDYNKARTYLLSALKTEQENKYVIAKINTLRKLVVVEEKTNQPGQAFKYLKQLYELEDSIKTNESKTAVAEIENKYQATQKQKEIIQLQKDKQAQAFSLKQKSALNYILFASLGVLMIVGLLLYRNYRQKQQLQLQQISELEKDRQLVAVDSLLKGQEEERSRLAKDLHDGLGGLLSGVKFSLSNMKDNLIVTPDNMAVFERSLDMLDTSIKELRRVAHNMMPEMLTKFGLDEALKEYANKVTETKLLQIKYQSFGMNERLDSSVEIIIYRIIQELVNNSLKHAAASDMLIQIVKEGSRLSVLAEDNGKGFDTALTESSKGAGWTSIRSRVEYLKGRIDLHSAKEKGTSVTIEFNL
ncbi:MAG: tetratricopeptide repeat protein [Chitinophagaceae bacterium]|nr:tetratricopeptide repeat protein [Chitinophagaceae bacterium]